MMRALLLGSVLFAAPLCAMESHPLPSGGMALTLEEREETQGDGSLVLRFRFKSDGLKELGYDAALPDLKWLCGKFAAPRLVDADGVKIIVSLQDKDLPFGEADPDMTMFMESYRKEGETCVEEPLF